jgi:hypothetical protein
MCDVCLECLNPNKEVSKSSCPTGIKLSWGKEVKVRRSLNETVSCSREGTVKESKMKVQRMSLPAALRRGCWRMT